MEDGYAALQLFHLGRGALGGVPFFVRAGKSLKMTCTEVLVELRQSAAGRVQRAAAVDGQLRPLPPQSAGGHRGRRSGEAPRGKAWPAGRSSCRSFRQPGGDEMDAYERLLGEPWPAMRRSSCWQDAVEDAWRIVDPVINRRERHAGRTSRLLVARGLPGANA